MNKKQDTIKKPIKVSFDTKKGKELFNKQEWEERFDEMFVPTSIHSHTGTELTLSEARDIKDFMAKEIELAVKEAKEELEEEMYYEKLGE